MPAAATAAPAETLVAETAHARLYHLALHARSGHPTRATLRLPRAPAGPLAAVVVIGGFRNGWRAAEYLDPGPDFALLSLDYPYDGRRSRIPVAEFLARAADFWRATHETSDLLLRAGDHLARRPGIDSTRVVVVGGSLGVPFALRAAAQSPRFRAVAVLYGSADIGEWTARNLRGVPGWARRPVGALVAALYRDYAPEQLIGRVSPRPVLLVNGRGDPRISEAGARLLYEAARAPKEQVWLDGDHVGLEKEDLLGRLFEVTSQWLRAQGFGGKVSAAADPR